MLTLTSEKASGPGSAMNTARGRPNGNLDGVVRATSRDLPFGIMPDGAHIVLVKLKRRPCIKCGDLTSLVQHTQGALWSWRLCWRHIAKDAIFIQYASLVVD